MGASKRFLLTLTVLLAVDYFVLQHCAVDDVPKAAKDIAHVLREKAAVLSAKAAERRRAAVGLAKLDVRGLEGNIYRQVKSLGAAMQAVVKSAPGTTAAADKGLPLEQVVIVDDAPLEDNFSPYHKDLHFPSPVTAALDASASSSLGMFMPVSKAMHLVKATVAGLSHLCTATVDLLTCCIGHFFWLLW